jgi:hypothetical protein
MENLDDPLPLPLSHLLVVQKVRIRRSTTVEQHRLSHLTSGGPAKQQKARHKHDQIRITRLIDDLTKVRRTRCSLLQRPLLHEPSERSDPRPRRRHQDVHRRVRGRVKLFSRRLDPSSDQAAGDERRQEMGGRPVVPYATTRDVGRIDHRDGECGSSGIVKGRRRDRVLSERTVMISIANSAWQLDIEQAGADSPASS